MKRIGFLIALVSVLAFSAGQAGAVVWTMPSGQANGPTNRVTATGGVVNTGGSTIIGSMTSAQIGTPTAPTLSTNGTAGATSLVYACTGFDINGAQTIPSATATITTGNATLSTTNSVNVFCPGKTGAVGFLVHKVDTSHVLAYCYTTSGVGCTVIDDGSVGTTFTYTPNTVDATGGFSGHLIASQGVAALPTVGTGTVAAGGSDFAMEVSGGTSPVTVTFAAAFLGKPVCACNDITSATGVCKAVPNSNGATVVVTTASTDTFELICVGK